MTEDQRSGPAPPDHGANALGRMVAQQAAVARLGQMGLRDGDLDVLASEAIALVGEALGAETVILFEIGPGSDALRGRCLLLDRSLMGLDVARQVLVPAGQYRSLVGYAAMADQAVVSGDLLADDRFTAQVDKYGVVARSAIAAPVGREGSTWGVLAAYRRAAGTWPDADVHFVEAVADTVGLAIERHRIEADLRDSSTRLDLSLGAGGLGAWTWDLRSDAVLLSPSACAIYGVDEESFDGSAEGFTELVHPEDRLTLRSDVYEAIQTGGEPHDFYRVTRGDGEVRWLEAWGRIVEEDGRPARLIGVVSDITDRHLADERRDSLLAGERDARAAAEQARERMSLLAEASERFSATLDPQAIVASVPELCVPDLADVCVVDLLDEQGELVEVVSRAWDPETLDAVRELRARREALVRSGALWDGRHAALGGESSYMPEITDADLQAAAVDAQDLDLVRRVGARSVLVAPLLARRSVIGVLTLMINRPGRRYGRDHLVLAEQLATRAALAIDNARLFESRNRVTRSLQAALLPPKLPAIEGVALAARYDVAEGDLAIGGDFYDVMEVGGGAWGVVVGDVCGRGPDAAALTGLVRHSVRTASVREQLPSRVLAQTNEAVLDQIDDDRFCTAAYLRLVPAPTGAVRVSASSAGHPRPVVLRSAAGHAEVIDCAGTLLGVVASPTLVDVVVDLEPGDSVVLYTDGVTEARRGAEQFGEEGLLAALGSLVGEDAEGIASGLERAVDAFQDDANDDVAILVVQAVAPRSEKDLWHG